MEKNKLRILTDDKSIISLREKNMSKLQFETIKNTIKNKNNLKDKKIINNKSKIHYIRINTNSYPKRELSLPRNSKRHNLIEKNKISNIKYKIKNTSEPKLIKNKQNNSILIKIINNKNNYQKKDKSRFNISDEYHYNNNNSLLHKKNRSNENYFLKQKSKSKNKSNVLVNKKKIRNISPILKEGNYNITLINNKNNVNTINTENNRNIISFANLNKSINYLRINKKQDISKIYKNLNHYYTNILGIEQSTKNKNSLNKNNNCKKVTQKSEKKNVIFEKFDKRLNSTSHFAYDINIKEKYDENNISNGLKNMQEEDNIKELHFDDYQIITQLGQGTFSKIYLVQDKNKNLFSMKKIILSDELNQ